jgi:hypothetical protein
MIEQESVLMLEDDIDACWQELDTFSYEEKFADSQMYVVKHALSVLNNHTKSLGFTEAKIHSHRTSENIASYLCNGRKSKNPRYFLF